MFDLAYRTITTLCPRSDDPAAEPATAFEVPGWADWTGAWLESGTGHPAVADLLTLSDNPFLDPALVAYLQKSPPGVETGLLVLRKKGVERVVATVQFLPFRADKQIQLGEHSKRGWRMRWAKWLRFEVLSVGQFLTTGPYAVATEGGALPAKLLPAAAEALARHLRKGGRRIHAVMLKDQVRLDTPLARAWAASGYHQLPVQPNMELVLPPSWTRTEHYLAALSSKYRVRYRRARKMGEGIDCRQLTDADMLRYRERMYALYRAIATDAGFNAIVLPPDYFLRLSEIFPRRLRVYGYFQRDLLVGFRTELAAGERLFAHFIGFDPALNRPTQLYQNMLYDLLESAIFNGFRVLDYGRTALEIKSSVGAEPVDYFCGLKSLIPGLNGLVPTIADYLSPPPDWRPRSPFK